MKLKRESKINSKNDVLGTMTPDNSGDKVKKRRLKIAMPFTFAMIVIALVFMFMMSPVAENVFIKSASAYELTSNPNNFISKVDFNGMTRSDGGVQVISYFTCDGAGNGAFWANSTMRTGGKITSVDISFDIDASWYTGKGYSANNTNFLTKTRVTIQIINPASSYTNITAYDYMTYAGDGTGTFELECDIPDYTFSSAGTYSIGYIYETYY